MSFKMPPSSNFGAKIESGLRSSLLGLRLKQNDTVRRLEWKPNRSCDPVRDRHRTWDIKVEDASVTDQVERIYHHTQVCTYLVFLFVSGHSRRQLFFEPYTCNIAPILLTMPSTPRAPLDSSERAALIRQEQHPNLGQDFEVIPVPEAEASLYNCFAYSMGITNEWISPRNRGELVRLCE